MSAEEVFGAIRAHKRELTGEPLTQDEVDRFNAIFAGWSRRVAPNPTALSDAQAFFKAVREKFGSLTQEQVDGFNALLQAMGGATWPLAWAAYGLATPWHETARTMRPIKEYGGPTYFRRMYDIEGERPAKARDLGNLTPGDGARYAGRGYVQLTGRNNYRKAGAALGIQIEADPDLALKADVAAKIMVRGMAEGWFTGKKLADYLPAQGSANLSQYQEARRIINGQDKAIEIARMAQAFEAALNTGGWA